jgi:hypothetical protein
MQTKLEFRRFPQICGFLGWRGLRSIIARKLHVRKMRRIAAAEELERVLEKQRDDVRRKELEELYGMEKTITQIHKNRDFRDLNPKS